MANDCSVLDLVPASSIGTYACMYICIFCDSDIDSDSVEVGLELKEE